MSISFEGPAIFVSDMAKARAFYEDVLGQEVLFAVADSYIAYTGGFSLWHVQSAHSMIKGEDVAEATPQGRDNFEMYFEDAEIQDAWSRVSAAGVEVAHEIREMPWGQRCFRVLDPEGHLVEIGEPMEAVIRRLLDQGLDEQEVSRRTMVPVEVIQNSRK